MSKSFDHSRGRPISAQVPAISNGDLKAVGAKYLPVVVENVVRVGDGSAVSILWQVRHHQVRVQL